MTLNKFYFIPFYCTHTNHVSLKPLNNEKCSHKKYAEQETNFF